MKRVLPFIFALCIILFALGACESNAGSAGNIGDTGDTGAADSTGDTGETDKPTADIAVLYTGDVHCAVDDNIGYAGLAAYKKSLEADGCEVVWVDTGDAIQGKPIGSYTKGESIIDIMNKLGCSAMTLGNHEFDYGLDNLKTLSERAEFPFLSLNFETSGGERLYDDSIILERAGVKIAFIGVSTPNTLTTSMPSNFQNDAGEFIYDFMGGSTGERLWSALQTSVDGARAAGADYVIVLAHLGIADSAKPFMSTELIANTTGIDAVLDGHSHSVIECERVKNKDGERVLLSSTGTGLVNIGLLYINRDGSVSTGLISDYTEKDADMTAYIDTLKSGYEAVMSGVAAELDFELYTNDPVTGARLVRNTETNLGDLCADAYLAAYPEADCAVVNGGGIRASIPAGEVTYGDILSVFPFGNMLCAVKATGQEILNALELGARVVPDESGGFLQVAGITYEIDTSVVSTVELDENGMFAGVGGEYRVKNVTIGGEPLELDREYVMISHNYMIKNGGDGCNIFTDNELVLDEFVSDYTALTEYLSGGVDAGKYADPYGEGRITAAE